MSYPFHSIIFPQHWVPSSSNFMTSSDSDRGLVRGRFRVGYALLPKKQDSFIQDSLISLARSRGVDLLRVSPSDPLPSQGPFDCLLHKLYDHHWNSQLHTFVRDNPDSLVIDPPDAIARLHNRISMLQVVSEVRIHDSDDSLGIPDQVVVYDPDDLLDGGSLRDLTFPLIAKPIVADGSAKSHEMALVFNAKGLDKLKPPIVLQQFVNHGGVIFKVYVVGEHVTCVKRKSLPDFTEESLGSLPDRDCLSFSQISNLRSEDEPGGPDDKSSGLEGMEMPPQSFLVEIANGMRNALRLNLFNFDIIRDVSCGNRYLVIDINYFPGYAKMPLYEKVLTDFFVDMARKMGKHLEDDGGSQEN